VQVGAFRVYENAEAYMEKLKADGYEAFIVEVNK
jgi:cell division septation protein DedD